MYNTYLRLQLNLVSKSGADLLGADLTRDDLTGADLIWGQFDWRRFDLGTIWTVTVEIDTYNKIT